MAVDKSLVSGSTTMLVLKLLEEKDMYGYEMIDTLRGKSKNVFELKAGTLYPLLHGLEEKGFVESYEKEAVGKIRKYYHITRSGKKELKKNDINYIKEEDIWNCLVELHWKKDKGLLLSDVVDDILNTENSVIDNYVKNEMKKMKREANYDVEII